MFPFIETILIENGIPQNLFYHNNRLNATRLSFWPDSPLLDLTDYVHSILEDGTWKCRVLYNKDIIELTYTPYVMRQVYSLQIIRCDQIEYTYKNTNREFINKLYEMRGIADEILIVKEKQLTDTSIANIALFDGSDWYTPLHPLLKGCRRASLLESGTIKEKDIYFNELFNYSAITLFNAMIDFRSIEININSGSILI